MLEELVDCYEGCSCEKENCSPTSGCSCISRFGPAFDRYGHLLDIVPSTGLLRPVFECHDYCSCGHFCVNRVVQHGVTVKLQVYDVGCKGVGVRTLQPIARGSFVCEYSGELLTYKSARRRSKNADPATHNYILAVREFFGTKSLTTYVDATYVGNVGRFINHSCEPNLFVQPVRVENSVPRVALFAARDIPVYTELTYDYSGGVNTKAECGCNFTLGYSNSANATDEYDSYSAPHYSGGRNTARECDHNSTSNCAGGMNATDECERDSTPGYSGGANTVGEYVTNSTPHCAVARKPCLCGSSRCRHFLPYDDAVFV